MEDWYYGEKITKKLLQLSFYLSNLIWERGKTMKYNIIDIVDKDLTDTKLKEIVNKNECCGGKK